MFYYLGGMLSYLGTIAGVWYLTRTHASPSNVVRERTMRGAPTAHCQAPTALNVIPPLLSSEKGSQMLTEKLSLPVPLPPQATRTWVLLGTGFCQGLSLGSLITPVFYFAPDLLFTAFLGTSAVFACFSGAAILSQRRSFLYLTATLSSIVSVMFTLVRRDPLMQLELSLQRFRGDSQPPRLWGFLLQRFASMFFASASAAVAGAELFIGLAVFIGCASLATCAAFPHHGSAVSPRPPKRHPASSPPAAGTSSSTPR